MFLNPLFLAGAALVAVPVLLHLLMRPRPKHLAFPALRFIRQRHDVNRRQMRLRNWLLLLLRAAVIAILALALARPTVSTTSAAGDREGPVAAAFIFDTLPRMGYRHENQTRLEAAQTMAGWLLGQLPEDSRIAVVSADTAAPTFQVDLGSARQRIDRVEINAVGRSLPEAVMKAATLLKTSELPKELYLFTDLSRSAWHADAAVELNELSNQLALTGVYIVDVGVEHPQNFALGELRLSGQTLASHTPLSIHCDLASIGAHGQRTVESFLVDRDGMSEKRSHEVVDMNDGQSVGLDFVVGGLDVGTHQGFLRLAGGDALAADDVRYFTVEVRAAWKVLIAAPQPADDYAFYLSEALAPEAFRKNGLARFEIEVVDYAHLADEALDHYAAVWLLDPPPLADAVWYQLAGYAQAGGGVAICVGDAAQPVASFNSDAAAAVGPAQLKTVARYPDGNVTLTPEEAEHPLLAKFKPMRGTIPWEAFPVYRAWQLSSIADASRVVIPYSNGAPALVERTLGRGRVLMLTTPLSESPHASAADRWNLLPTGFEPWPFVMLANEMTLYLAGSSDTQLNYSAGQTATLRLQPEQRRPTYLLTSPGGSSERITADPKNNIIACSATDEPGDYRIAAGGERDGVHLGFSVNLAAEATQLDRTTPDEVKRLFGTTNVRVARSRDELEREVSTSRVGRELFPLLMVVLAVVLGLEHVLANRFYRASGDGLRASGNPLSAGARSPSPVAR